MADETTTDQYQSQSRLHEAIASPDLSIPRRHALEQAVRLAGITGLGSLHKYLYAAPTYLGTSKISGTSHFFQRFSEEFVFTCPETEAPGI